MLADGVDSVVLEATSHALDLNRVDDIDFNIAVFTNLTQDHLDHHKTFENYFEAKKILFRLLNNSPKHNKAGIVNIDNEYGKKLFSEKEKYSYKMFGFGTAADTDYKIKKNSIHTTIHGTNFEFEKPYKKKISLEIIGDFQVYNSLAAYSVCHAMGISNEIIIKGLQNLTIIPGRFNTIKAGFGFLVVVDYAHTDDSVRQLLESVKELNPQRIITVLGCGGNRDKTKRPLMGKAAVSNSDFVIFTSDNPRDENPDQIISDIIRDMKAANFETITDREQAIKKAIYSAQKNDIVVIAGKGHEEYQMVKGKKIHFDDREIAAKYIKERETN
jgi:UDP-N-acetylmuramoyl-L-alanyl-D-glutamate--2,6-diaminopimelate ligase